jgi:radical SAM superfamily enzyme YgiQ (UPF0313 family)
MPDILLVAINSKYAHTSFAIRYLLANLGDLTGQAAMLEATLEDRAVDILEKILLQRPKVVGLSVYIWNALASLELVQALKRVSPETVVVLGGPEVSYETELQEIAGLADYVVVQEGEVAFRELCQQLLSGELPESKIVRRPLAKAEDIVHPYSLYSDTDLQHRVIYVEASRGCPFRCEFCLSSLDASVRNFPLGPLLEQLERLFQRGARQFKFIDRTFNLKLDVSTQILQFFLDRYVDGLFVHFEMIPDRFPDELRELVQRFPAGSLQFEIGIQSFDPEVGQRISRRQDFTRLKDNLRFLRQETGVHIHADLIVGLPGEDIEMFGKGFDQLVELDPQEIQVGILKRLRGTPIVRHDQEWSMVYAPNPPYEILQTSSINFSDMQRMKRFARYWDLVANRGQFPLTLKLLLGQQPFKNFLEFSDWLFFKVQSTHKFSLVRLAELLMHYLEQQAKLSFQQIVDALGTDYTADGKRYLPPFLVERDDLPANWRERPKVLRSNQQELRLASAGAEQLPNRQARHVESSRGRTAVP